MPATAEVNMKPAAKTGGIMHGTAWLADGSGMTITDPDQLKRLRREELSASTSFNLDPDVCAVSMVVSRLVRDDDGPFEQNQLGTAAHAVLEYLFSQPGPQRTKKLASATSRRLRNDTEFADEMLGHDLAPKIRELDEADTVKWLFEVDRRVHGLWEIEDPTQITVYKTELGFGGKDGLKANIGRVPFIGYIDRLDTILDKTTREIIGFVVDDYKAGKYKDGRGRFGDDYGDQVRIYKVAVKDALGIDPVGGNLLFITYGKGRPIDFSEEAVAVTVARFERAWDRMHELADANIYPTKVGPLCGWCPLVNVCPAAIAAGKTDLTNTEKDPKTRKRSVVLDADGKPTPLKGIPASELHIPTIERPVIHDIRRIAKDEIPDAKTADAAHREGNERKTPMTTATQTPVRIKEGTNPREAAVDNVLNGNSYAASAVFGIASLAVEELVKNGREVNGSNVNALVYTYVHIIQTVQFNLSGSANWQDGLNTRIRGALRTTVETLPAPWGGNQEAWDEWVAKATKRTRSVASVAIKIWEAGSNIPENPWTALASA